MICACPTRLRRARMFEQAYYTMVCALRDNTDPWCPGEAALTRATPWRLAASKLWDEEMREMVARAQGAGHTGDDRILGEEQRD